MRRMVRRCRLGPALVLTALFGLPIGAQDFAYRGEVLGTVGYGGMTDDETNLGNGLALGGGIGYRLNRRWGVSLELWRNGHRRDASSFEFAGYALLIAAGIQYHFRPESDVQPYLRFGASFAYYSGTDYHKPFVPPDPAFPPQPALIRRGSQSFVGPDCGVGVKFMIRERISIRPEVRFAAMDSPREWDPSRDILEPPLWNGWFSVGLGYHW